MVCVASAFTFIVETMELYTYIATDIIQLILTVYIAMSNTYIHCIILVYYIHKLVVVM